MIMIQWTGLWSGAVCAFLLGSTAVHAEITAAEVWQGMTDYYSDLGQRITTGSQQMEGDTLVVRDAVFASTVPEGSFSATLEEIRLRELGDGRVEVTVSDEMAMVMSNLSESGETVDMGMRFIQSGMVVVVSGTAADTIYEFVAPEMQITSDTMSVDGSTVPLKIVTKMTGTSGNFRMATAAGRNVTSDYATDKLDFEISAKEPEGKGNFSVTGSLTGLSGTSNAMIPDDIDMNDMNAALQRGLAMDGQIGFSGGGYVMDFNDAEQSSHIQSTGGTGKLNFSLSKQGLAYGGEVNDSDMSIQAPPLPMPVDLSVAHTAFNIALPVTKDEAAQPFSALVKLVDLTVSDGIWSLFDPAGQLPRDPATLIADLSGTAKMQINIFDATDARTIAGTPPGELESLDIRELKLSAAGAELTGNGSTTFDNSGGTPKPVGAIDLQLVGGNGLIDKLVAMGLVPEDWANGARVMMGFYAVPAGEDTLTSKIEFKQDGSVYANGQRIQ